MIKSLVIRIAELSDLQEVIEIDRILFQPNHYPDFVVRQLFDISKSTFFVAEYQKQIIGYSIGNFDSKTKIGWNLSMAVKKEYQKKGIGKLLLKERIKFFKDSGAEKIMVTVKPNSTAHSIYSLFGFETDFKDENYFFDNEERLVLKKTMPNNGYK